MEGWTKLREQLRDNSMKCRKTRGEELNARWLNVNDWATKPLTIAKIQKESRSAFQDFHPWKGTFGWRNSKWLDQKFRNHAFLDTLPKTYHWRCFISVYSAFYQRNACGLFILYSPPLYNMTTCRNVGSVDRNHFVTVTVCDLAIQIVRNQPALQVKGNKIIISLRYQTTIPLDNEGKSVRLVQPAIMSCNRAAKSPETHSSPWKRARNNTVDDNGQIACKHEAMHTSRP